MEILSAEVRGTAMCQVPTHTKVKPQHFFAGLYASQKNRSICLRTAMRLYVGPGSIENPLQAINSQRFNFINDLATAIISFAGITLCIFISRHRPHGLHYL